MFRLHSLHDFFEGEAVSDIKGLDLNFIGFPFFKHDRREAVGLITSDSDDKQWMKVLNNGDGRFQ